MRSFVLCRHDTTIHNPDIHLRLIVDCFGALNGLHNIHSLYDMAEYNMFSVEMRSGLARNKEL
jgi:hypothetical protein